MTHICVGKLTIIGSDNGLLPGRRQAIIWTSAGILLIEPFGTNFSEILIGIKIFSFKKMCLKMPSAKWRPFCLGLNELSAITLNVNMNQYIVMTSVMVCCHPKLGRIVSYNAAGPNTGLVMPSVVAIQIQTKQCAVLLISYILGR